MERLKPLIADALSAPESLDLPLLESPDRELIIADCKGRIVFMSGNARRLLALATETDAVCDGGEEEPPALPPGILRICQNILGLHNGDDERDVPALRTNTISGEFAFRAYRIDPTDGSPSLVGILLAHRQPWLIRLASQVSRLPLTPRQAEVCFLMAVGLSYLEIAERLGISQHTAVAHNRCVYAKLKVGNRTELVQKLLAGN